MKVLIMSDSHGLTDEVLKIKNAHQVDYMIHCGDSELPADHEALEDVFTVKGNCDLDDLFPEVMVQEIGGWRFMLIHGHQYGVKSSLQRLQYAAIEKEAHVVCFGHTHLLYVDQVDERLFINPGSICFPHIGQEKTYIILKIENEVATVEAFNLAGEKINFKKQQFFLHKK